MEIGFVVSGDWLAVIVVHSDIGCTTAQRRRQNEMIVSRGQTGKKEEADEEWDLIFR